MTQENFVKLHSNISILVLTEPLLGQWIFIYLISDIVKKEVLVYF